MADLHEETFRFEGSTVAVQVGWSGLPVLMIHGSGPGASTLGNWRSVLGPLSENFHVHAMDLIGFGRSDRKAQPPYFDFELWHRQVTAMIERMPAGGIAIIGHSISGALALRQAAINARVVGVLATGTMGLPFALNDGTVRTWTYPRDREALIAAARTLIKDPELIDEAYLRNRDTVLRQPGYEDYFGEMFGGDKQLFIDAAIIPDSDLARIRCPVSLIHGRDDEAFPAAPLSIRIAEHIPHADLYLLGNCSHSIAMEHPDKLIATALSTFARDGTSPSLSATTRI